MKKLALLAIVLLAACGSSPSRGLRPPVTCPTPSPTSCGSTVTTTTTPSGPSTTIAPAPTPTHCGVERWAIKTATDPGASSINLAPISSTIGQLAAGPSPLTGSNGNARLPGEMQTYTLTTTLISYKIEADSDIHLVLSDSTGHMIAEIPNPGCVASGGILRGAIASSRAAFVAKTGFKGVTRLGVNRDMDSTGLSGFVNVSIPVKITGVMFYDFLHGQTGVAPNGVELHPVTAISFP